MNEMVSIAIHSGKKEYFPLVENLLKSFLVCNEYPNVELILIESAKNLDIREWFSKINFDDYFINFDGAKTSIRKNENTSIKKATLFLDFEDDIPWHFCYMKSLESAVEISAGNYFAFMAEDNQFIIKGNVIGEYIKMLDSLGHENTMINFSGMQAYKYAKENNEHGIVKNIDGIKYFPVSNVKWDPTYLCNKKIYDKLGDFVFGDESNPHMTINNFIKVSEDLGLTRVYKAIPHAIWFHNENRDKYIKTIRQKTSADSSYVLFSVDSLNNVGKMMGYWPARPLATDDWFDRQQG